MRKFLIVIVTFLSTVGYAQRDSTRHGEWSIGAGISFTQTMIAPPALAGEFKLHYGVLQLSAKYGENRTKVRNLRGFDQVYISGDWREVGLSLIVPYEMQSKRLEGVKFGVGFGVSNMEAEYQEIFEALPPFNDLVYSEKHTNRGQKYVSFSMGYQIYVAKYVEVSAGVVGYNLFGEVNVPLKANLTPFKARSPVGFYLDMAFVL